MAAPAEPSLLGRLLVESKIISFGQLTSAIGIQGRYGNQKKLGEILIECGYITQAQLDGALRAQQATAQKKAAAEHRARAAAGDRATALPDLAFKPLISLELTSIDASTTPSALVLVPPESQAPAVEASPTKGRRSTATPEIRPAAVGKPQSQASNAPAGPAPRQIPTGATVSTSTTSAARGLDLILAQATKFGASDVHIHAGSQIEMRHRGVLVQGKGATLDAATSERLILEILAPADRERLLAENDIDVAYTLKGVARFRLNVYRQKRGIDAVFRIIPATPPTLQSLGLPSMLARLTTYHQGLVLLTGPAGSGKSSTMAALVNLINEDRPDHILTVEDPIEYIHASKRCVVNQRQVVRHTGSFAAALRAALREDPDIIAIGELRDLETVSLAITASETGHLVLATLHTNNTIRTINRILDVFPPQQQSQIRSMVSESLRAVVSQRLVPAADGSRRVPAVETLFVNHAIANLIRDDKMFQIRSVLQTGRAQGMGLLDDSLADLVKAGTVTKEAARQFAEDPRQFA